MPKNKNLLFEWRTLDDQTETTEPDLPIPHDAKTSLLASLWASLWPSLWPSLWIVFGFVLLLVVAGGWRIWRLSQAGIRQIEQDVAAVVTTDLWAAGQDFAPSNPHVFADLAAAVEMDPAGYQIERAWQEQMARELAWLAALLNTAESVTQIRPHLQTEVELIALQEDVAAVNVITRLEGEASAVRQVHFYRQVGEKWRRTSPMAELWGAPRRLETDYFVFHYRRRDEPAVADVAAQVDDIYRRLAENFGVRPGRQVASEPGGRADGPIAKLGIEIGLTTRPGSVLVWVNPNQPLRVASPALYQVPLELSDATLLHQTLVLSLIFQVWTQAVKEYDLALRWTHMVYGLRLWQLWDLDVPLAGYRASVVQWLYQSNGPDVQSALLPTSYAEFCAMHRLWMLGPEQWQIPLTCRDAAGTGEQFPLNPPLNLRQLKPWHTVAEHPPESQARFGEEAVALATLIDYVVQRHGRAHLPDLLAGLAQYDTWETLLPAVYGVSAHEFEAGWQAYLQAEYGVGLDPKAP